MLETSFTLPNGLVISNRLAKAATTEALATRDHEVGERMMTLYAHWASSGAGLLVTGNVGIDPAHPVRPGDAMVLASSPREPLRRWAKLIRSEGSRGIPQICHAGRQTQRWKKPHPLAPSAVRAVKTLRVRQPTGGNARGDRRAPRALRQRCTHRRGGRLRRLSDPFGPRLPAEPVPLARFERPVRRLRRADREPRAAPAGDRSRGEEAPHLEALRRHREAELRRLPARRL